MEPDSFRRKLCAIMSADVEGYSLLMRDSEEATIRTLSVYRKAMAELIRKYRGRVVDAPGDNILAEFISAVDAVACAVEIQRELSERNDELPADRRMRFRVGINLGDILEEDGRIYGDGVNIAARIEGLAEGGGICISGTVYDAVENKLDLAYEFTGVQEVKNIDQPVRVYRVLSYPGAAAHRVIKSKKAAGKIWRKVNLVVFTIVVMVAAALFVWYFYLRPSPSEAEVASVERMAFPLPEKPSIAVLPFDNMSGDPGQEYFSDGITESVITTLSKIPDLFVIARNSTFVYKGQPVKIQQVAEDLGVRYVLEGSVQRTADRIRVTAQLIDAATGSHMWAERYNSDLSDIFRIQDEITIEITRQLRVKLIEGDQVRLRAKQDTENLEAYEKALQGRAYSFRGTKDDNALARKLYEDALALDPEFVSAYASLGWTHFWDARFGWSESKDRSLEEAFSFAQKANSLDDTLDDSHLLLAAVYLLRREWEEAVVEAERAVALNPNGADAYSVLSGIVSCVGRWEDGIVYAKKSIRLNPFPPIYYYHWLGRAYFMTGKYDEAIKTWDKVLQINPEYVPAYTFLAATYSTMNRNKDAEDKIAEVLRIDPKFCIESYAQTLPYKNQSDIDRYVKALRKAGLPERPPAGKVK